MFCENTVTNILVETRNVGDITKTVQLIKTKWQNRGRSLQHERGRRHHTDVDTREWGENGELAGNT